MINLLPEAQKKALRHEYALRVGIVACGFALILEAEAAALLAPAYIELRSHVDANSRELERVTALVPKDDADAKGAVAGLGRQIDKLRGVEKTPLFSEYVDKLVAAKVPGIALSNVSFVLRGDVPELSLSGSARDRDALSAFRKNLRANPEFVDADFPTSAFLKETDISFSMKLVVKVPKKP